MATSKKHPRKNPRAGSDKPAGLTGKKPVGGSGKSKSGKSSSVKSRKWSAHVTETSDALDLRKGVFTLEDPKKIASSLERSAEKSQRKKSGSYQSAMSMLNFYINRAGKNLPARQKKKLEKAKEELKALHEKQEKKKS